jgi:hypothetical protein
MDPELNGGKTRSVQPLASTADDRRIHNSSSVLTYLSAPISQVDSFPLPLGKKILRNIPLVRRPVKIRH